MQMAQDKTEDKPQGSSLAAEEVVTDQQATTGDPAKKAAMDKQTQELIDEMLAEDTQA